MLSSTELIWIWGSGGFFLVVVTSKLDSEAEWETTVGQCFEAVTQIHLVAIRMVSLPNRWALELSLQEYGSIEQ